MKDTKKKTEKQIKAEIRNYCLEFRNLKKKIK